MKHLFGINEFLAKQKNATKPIIYDSDEVINNHILFAGASGSGKSFQLLSLMSRAALYGYALDIFDVHEELSLPESSPVKYSSHTKFGYNPLIVSADIHSGGVRNRINSFISMINSTSSKLGTKQQSALRNLLEDLYAEFGITDADYRSWRTNPQDQPTITDLIAFNKMKIMSMQFGTDQIATTLMELNRKVAKIRKQNIQKHSHNEKLKKMAEAIAAEDTDEESLEELKQKIDTLRDTAIDLFNGYVLSMANGNEIDNYYKYNNREVLLSLNERLTNINSAGIFNHNPPPFDSDIHCHQIKSLSDDEQKLFVYLRLESIFREARDAGMTDTLRHIIVLDEAHKFFDDEPDHIINVISKEGRKFGLALWCASQSPTHFTPDFLTNCGIIMLLGIHSSYWDMACRKLRIKPENLKFTKARQVASVKLQKKGEADPQFQNVVLTSYLNEFYSQHPQLPKLEGVH